MVMAMRRGVVPASLHVDVPTPHVDWASGAVRVVSEAVSWPEVDRPRRAGVSSFGASGTNAHVIIEHVPEPTVPTVPEREPAADAPTPWALSARSPEALREQAHRLKEAVAGGVDPAEVGWSLLTTRAAHEHRAVVVGSERAELIAG
ncbi:ketoacyl-synthetase C-terminal extension domain-containing protein, partial [Streptomyces mobaraensis]